MTTSLLPRRLLAILFALALVAAACGDDDSSSSASASDTASASETESSSASASSSSSASGSASASEPASEPASDEAMDDASEDDAMGDEPADEEAVEEDAMESSGAFPMTIVHKFGETVLESQPERVVSVGYNEHDFLLAIDVVPVGLRDWYGEQPNSVWPWGQEALGDAEPVQIADTNGLNYEAIAAANPDVIVGVWSGMTEEEYELLSEIAPVIAQSDEYLDYGTPWQEQTMLLGQVTGRDAEAEAAVVAVQERIEAARDAHPEWQGKTAAVGFLFEGNPGFYNSEDPRSRFLSDLGFTIPAEFDEQAGDAFFFETTAETLAEDADVDLIVWVAGAEEQYAELVDALPTRTALRAYQEGGEIFASTLLTGAFSHSSPLSLEFVVETLVPEIELAVDGDPSTTVPSAVQFGTVAG